MATSIKIKNQNVYDFDGNKAKKFFLAFEGLLTAMNHHCWDDDTICQLVLERGVLYLAKYWRKSARLSFLKQYKEDNPSCYVEFDDSVAPSDKHLESLSYVDLKDYCYAEMLLDLGSAFVFGEALSCDIPVRALEDVIVVVGMPKKFQIRIYEKGGECFVSFFKNVNERGYEPAIFELCEAIGVEKMLKCLSLDGVQK